MWFALMGQRNLRPLPLVFRFQRTKSDKIRFDQARLGTTGHDCHSEVGGRKSEVRGPQSKVQSPRSKVQRPKSEVGRRSIAPQFPRNSSGAMLRAPQFAAFAQRSGLRDLWPRAKKRKKLQKTGENGFFDCGESIVRNTVATRMKMEEKRSFWVLASFWLSHRPLRACSFRQSLAETQKSSLRVAALFLQTLPNRNIELPTSNFERRSWGHGSRGRSPHGASATVIFATRKV